MSKLKIKLKHIPVAIALSISPIAHADLTTGLVAYYPFSGNANDASGNGNNGTVYGATLTADRNGNANSAYQFDGQQYIVTTLNRNDYSNITAAVWFKFDGNISDGYADILSGESNDFAIAKDYLTSNIGVQDGEYNPTIAVNTNAWNGNWHHLVYTYTIGTGLIFLDGILKGQGNFSGGTGRIWIGHENQEDGFFFKGQIDEVRIYNRALTASEIQQLYQQDTPQATTTTLASSLNPAALGQNVIFTGKVTAATVPNGNLTFKVDGSTKYSSNLTNGQLTYVTNTLTAGAHTIRAEYAGDTTFAASAAQLTQTITSKPDLIVTAVNLTPPQPTVGNTFTATVTVKNQGGGGDGGQLRLWTNQPTVQVCAASGGDKTLAVGSVAAGASKTLTFTGLNPGVKGAKILRAFVDAVCTVAETNDTNNQLVKGYMVKDLRADFIVTALTLTPASPTANNLFTVSATVKNQGMAARAAGYLDVWVNKPTAPGCGAADNDDWIDLGTLAAGASKTVTLSMVADTAGTKTARAYIDSWCETIEANETNNQLIKSYTVQ